MTHGLYPQDINVIATLEWMTDLQPETMSIAQLEGLSRYVLAAEGQTGEWEIAVRVVGDDEISAIHARYLGDASATDIITFPYDDEDGVQGGDIVISADTAAENAKEQGWLFADEIEFLVIHGLLHILGWDDASDEYRVAMLKHQATLHRGWRDAG